MMILIADDSKFMRIYLKQILQNQGYTKFVKAINGEQAIILYRLLKPKLVFLDITMPIFDGLTVLREIMKINPEAKIIMCSALGTREHKQTALELGAVDFVTKPNFDSIHAILKEINKKSGDEANA